VGEGPEMNRGEVGWLDIKNNYKLPDDWIERDWLRGGKILDK